MDKKVENGRKTVLDSFSDERSTQKLVKIHNIRAWQRGQKRLKLRGVTYEWSRQGHSLIILIPDAWIPETYKNRTFSGRFLNGVSKPVRFLDISGNIGHFSTIWIPDYQVLCLNRYWFHKFWKLVFYVLQSTVDHALMHANPWMLCWDEVSFV